MHIEDVASGRESSQDDTAKEKVSSIKKEITSVRFVKMLHFMLDFLDVITATYRIFQQEKLTIPEVPDITEETTMKLTSMKQHMGKHSKEFYENINGVKQFGSQKIQLTGPAPPPYKEDNDMKKLLEKAISYLESRFENFSDAPLSYFKVFNFKFWPQEREQLAGFGADEIQSIVNYYKDLLREDECNKIPLEWVALKNYVTHFCGSPLLKVYGDLLRDRPSRLQNVLVLVEVMLTVSPSRAECERQFSSMNRNKTTLRNRLANDTLQALMKINCDGPSLDDFDPEQALDKWMISGLEGRHLAGHKKPITSFAVLHDHPVSTAVHVSAPLPEQASDSDTGSIHVDAELD